MSTGIVFEKKNQETDDKIAGKSQEGLVVPIQSLVKKYQEIFTAKQQGEISTIHVDEIASKVASFYEKVRRVIDWKEENVLRRSAIERIIKRSLVTEIPQVGFNFHNGADKIANSLVRELIRGGHLANDSIPETKDAEVEKLIEKYLHLIKNTHHSKTSAFPLKKRVNFYNWILAIAAAEIEEVLAPPEKENALINTMTLLMNERIRVVPKGKIDDQNKLIQTYIATHRTLFDLDDAIIAYRLIKHKYPQWLNADEKTLAYFSQNIIRIWEEIENDLNHPLRKDFFNICEKTDTVFTLLDDVLNSFKKNPLQIEATLTNRQSLNQRLSLFYKQRLTTLKKRLFRLGIYSTLSVFFSNWFTYFLVEVPLAKLVYEGFNFFAAFIDFTVPSLVMFLLVALIRPPRSGNLEKLLEMVQRFIYQDEGRDIYEIKLDRKKNWLINLIIFLIYSSAGLFTLTGIAWIFYKAKIPGTSVILDTLMIALNIFAALIIRNKAKEITVEDKTSFWEFTLDILSVPVAKVGSFLANKWREYNIFSVFLNVFVEMPFISLISFIEGWSQFVKERKAELH